jgi:hypothetical protein
MTKKSVRGRYKGKAFDREQVICVAESILGGAMDMLQSGLPDSICWDERVGSPILTTGPRSLTAYERGVLEGAGESLAVFYARATDDGMSCYDALAAAAKFDSAVEELFSKAWSEEGYNKVRDKLRRFQRDNKGWSSRALYPNWPNLRKHAEAFADVLLGDDQ